MVVSILFLYVMFVDADIPNYLVNQVQLTNAYILFWFICRSIMKFF